MIVLPCRDRPFTWSSLSPSPCAKCLVLHRWYLKEHISPHMLVHAQQQSAELCCQQRWGIQPVTPSPRWDCKWGHPEDSQVSNHLPSGPGKRVPSLNSHKTVLPQSLGETQGTCASCSQGWLQLQQHLIGKISPRLSQCPFQTLSQHLLPVPPQPLAPMLSSLLVLIQSGVKAHVTALLAASPPTCWP